MKKKNVDCENSSFSAAGRKFSVMAKDRSIFVSEGTKAVIVVVLPFSAGGIGSNLS